MAAPRQKYFKYSRALIARLLFAIHALTAIWRTYLLYHDLVYWLFSLLVIAMFVEGAIIILQRDGNETKWFCLSIFLYLSGTVPPLWFMELYVSDHYRENLMKAAARMIVGNSTSTSAEVEEEVVVELVPGVGMKFEIPKLGPEQWVQYLEQTLLVVLIIGRWILPKGAMSREQLSQLLLVYMATAADIVEFFECFKEPAVRSSRKMTYIVLSIWTISLLQYPLVIASGKKSQRPNLNPTQTEKPMAPQTAKDIEDNRMCCLVCGHVAKDVNILGILVSVLLQDGPFLSIRLYLMIWFELKTYSMIFFTCKNFLIFTLQIYRLMIICFEGAKQAKSQQHLLLKILETGSDQDAHVAVAECGDGNTVIVVQSSGSCLESRIGELAATVVDEDTDGANMITVKSRILDTTKPAMKISHCLQEDEPLIAIDNQNPAPPMNADCIKPSNRRTSSYENTKCNVNDSIAIQRDGNGRGSNFNEDSNLHNDETEETELICQKTKPSKRVYFKSKVKPKRMDNDAGNTNINIKTAKTEGSNIKRLDNGTTSKKTKINNNNNIVQSMPHMTSDATQESFVDDLLSPSGQHHSVLSTIHDGKSDSDCIVENCECTDNTGILSRHPSDYELILNLRSEFMPVHNYEPVHSTSESSFVEQCGDNYVTTKKIWLDASRSTPSPPVASPEPTDDLLTLTLLSPPQEDTVNEIF